jgi:triphosphatase
LQPEIELKLTIPDDAFELIEQQVLSVLDAEIYRSQFQLRNSYFDTPTRELRHHDIGFRVRKADGVYEQTIKTSGKVLGGLHQRPEYNVALNNDQPDLKLFDANIFPEDWDIERIQQALVCLFTTDFQRTCYDIRYPSGVHIELIFDKGSIQTENDSESLCELEIELKTGQADCLFDLAEEIGEIVPVRVGNLSKAARGYRLADGTDYHITALSDRVSVREGESFQSIFCAGIALMLKQWQQYETLYQQSPSSKHLFMMLNNKRQLALILKLAERVFNETRIGLISQRLKRNLQQWHWLDSLLAIKQMRSKKGSFSVKLTRHENLLSYLKGRYEGMLTAYNPVGLIEHTDNHRLQMSLCRLLETPNWKVKISIDVNDFAKQLMEEEWQQLKQTDLMQQTLSVSGCLESEPLLREVLCSGFLFGDLFDEQAVKFRAPWLDMLEGIEELKILEQLQQELTQNEWPEGEELLDWSREKTNNLIKVMQGSLVIAKQMQPYW